MVEIKNMRAKNNLYTAFLRLNFLFITIFFIFLSLYSVRLWSDTKDEITEEIKKLSKEAEHTTDPNRLMEIEEQIMQLGQELANLQGTGADIPFSRAATPEEEAKRECKMINMQGAKLKAMLPQIASSAKESKSIPVTHAVPIKGYTIIDGKYESKPYRGWIWKRLQYKVIEKFVGYITITEYYNTQSRMFDIYKDFGIHTFSTDIDVKSFSGKECIRASSGIPGNCEKWEYFSRYIIPRDNRYPSIQEWVVSGQSEESKIDIEVEAPSVHFKSNNGRASGGIGCAEADFEMSTEQFEQIIKSGKIDLEKSLSYQECNKGSSITLHIKITSPECYIRFLGNKNGLVDCDATGGMLPNILLEGYLKTGTPILYKWRLLSGSNLVTFKNGKTTTKKITLHPISASRMPYDVIVEVDIKNNKGYTCIATCSLTIQKPTSLRILTEEEMRTLGIEPYVNYKELCNHGHCAKIPEELGGGTKSIIDGYLRKVTYQVLDQFGLPIEKPEMFWNEKRWVVIQGHRIELPYLGEGNGVQVPVNPHNPNGPKFTMYSNNGITEKGGKIVDFLMVAYPEGTGGVPQNFDITVEQNFNVMKCKVGHSVQHYKSNDAAVSYTPP